MLELTGNPEMIVRISFQFSVQCLQFDVSHDRSVYTMGLGRHYKPRLCGLFRELAINHLPAYHSPYQPYTVLHS